MIQSNLHEDVLEECQCKTRHRLGTFFVQHQFLLVLVVVNGVLDGDIFHQNSASTHYTAILVLLWFVCVHYYFRTLDKHLFLNNRALLLLQKRKYL